MPADLSKAAVLNLYRSLVRYARDLELSDKPYYLRRLRTEFEKHRDLADDKERQFYFQVSWFAAMKAGFSTKIGSLPGSCWWRKWTST
ncbi:MIEF1 upstream open reading frame protein isoform X2 [Ixodes scapularis]|uniref:MIEF1 upstream open reading frame protein isoform X2 n=1 Tax=Ixodes scapularis TaxID=6945 RepID=UPI001AD76F13|nr:MIEF1 upstream open reading frame protein isoform X2 [Ixodes scapularis]XP_040358833.1 MIEF1 upstream open reading frame protein isoform X2 [Ixodes scapularis]